MNLIIALAFTTMAGFAMATPQQPTAIVIDSKEEPTRASDPAKSSSDGDHPDLPPGPIECPIGAC
jgi:hypothetical protein